MTLEEKAKVYEELVEWAQKPSVDCKYLEGRLYAVKMGFGIVTLVTAGNPTEATEKAKAAGKSGVFLELHEMCEGCDMLELETTSVNIFGMIVKDHRCKRASECSHIRKNWEKHHRGKNDPDSSCETCDFRNVDENVEPCVKCSHRYDNKWKGASV